MLLQVVISIVGYDGTAVALRRLAQREIVVVANRSMILGRIGSLRVLDLTHRRESDHAETVQSL